MLRVKSRAKISFSASQTYLTFTGTRDRIPLAGVVRTADVGNCESCAFQNKNRQWQEYLDFGPHGLSVIRNSGAHRLRRAGWLCFMLMGLYLCTTHMYMNIQKYFEFKSQERPSINKKHEITFPKGKLN